MRSVDRLTAGYLALAPLALVGAGRPAAWPLLVSAHLAGILAITLVARADGVTRGPALARHALRVLRRWYPLILMPFLYAELRFLNQSLVVGYRDDAILALEQALFRMQPARTLAGALPFPLLSELLHAGYLSYYLLIYAPPLVLYLRGRDAEFGEMLFSEMLTFYACYLVFVFFPVQGPRYLWPAPPGVPDGPLRALALFLLEAGSSQGAAFPSSHVAVALMQTIVAFRALPRLAPVMALLTLALGAGAVYSGFHYATDVAAGAATAVLLVPVARSLGPRLKGRLGPRASEAAAGLRG
ncbi:MAG: phosphatase PAP2 family protein [Gemmatimonadetes bacterium]|nr:phosphatase PAP2 family protein [Gemmatimonadota bacterium]